MHEGQSNITRTRELNEAALEQFETFQMLYGVPYAYKDEEEVPLVVEQGVQANHAIYGPLTVSITAVNARQKSLWADLHT